MDSPNIDNVKVEKAKAMMRYKRIQGTAKLLRALEVCVALTFLSYSSSQFQNALRFSGDYIVKLSGHLLNSHIAFLMGNMIVLILYLLSRQNYAGQNHGAADLYGEYIENSEARLRMATANGGDTPAPEKVETPYEDKQMVLPVNVDSKTKSDEIPSASASASEEAEKKIRRLERTQSVKLKREIQAKPRRALRRSETETRRRITPSGDEEAIRSWEDLSNEEFRRTIDASLEQLRLSSRRSV